AASVSGSVIFADFPSIEGLKISKGGSSFSLNAVLNKEKLDIRSEGNNIDGEFLSELLDLPFDMGGSARIKMSAAGPLSSPDMLLSVGISGGSIMNIPFDTMDAEIVSSKNRAEIKKARVFKKNEIDVSVSGSFPLWLDSSLDKEMRKERVDVSYEIDDSKMNIIRYLSSEFFKPRAGKITAKGSIKGSPEKISNSGQLNVSGGYMDVENYFDKIKNFTADIAWKDNTVKINKFALKSGPGNFNLSGDIILKGFSVQSLNLKAATDNKGIFLKVPELPIPVSIFSRGILQDFSNAEPRFDLSITGAPETPVISGWISLENARFTFPPPDGFGGASFLPEKTEFNVELRTAKNTKFENSYANAWINGKIKLTGPLDGIRAAGIIESQRGNVEYMGVNFDIISSKIEIVDDNKVFITMEGQTDVYYPGNNQPENIRMAIDRSELSSLNVRFFSKDDPTMDSQTALAKVTRTEQTQQSENTQLAGLSDFVLRQQALRLIDSSFATPLARTFLRRTRLVDNFRVSYVQQEPQDSSKTGSGEDMSFLSLFYGTKYSLEKNITNQLLLGYSITFDQFDKKLDLRHEIEMRYRLPWDLFLTGTYELQSDSYHQPDRKIMLEHQFRFGLPSLGTGNAKKTRSVEQK
ncbi:MAG: translocation/assembly module TamB domain-containing protein, partial [Endomicrobia bacterium]|nr:translocation/assembly module TamB domain-containing protein [Endomicrobiia bacterium]